MKLDAKYLSYLFVLISMMMGIQPDSVDAQLKKMIVGQAGVNPGAGLFSIAVNQGLYKKHGLDVEIIKTNTAAAVQAMLAGKMQMATGAGAAAFVTATLEGAPPFVLVASWVNVFPYKIMAQKSIQKVEDLKGKTGHVGAPFGTIPDTALRFALTRLKIDPDKDVKLVQHSGADPASILAAMEKGEVQFGILAPPFDLIAEKRGYTMLLALPGLGIPWQQNGELVPASYLKSNRDNVLRLLQGNRRGGKILFRSERKNHRDHDRILGPAARRNRIRLQPVQALDRPHPTTASRYDQNDARSDQEKYPQSGNRQRRVVR